MTERTVRELPQDLPFATIYLDDIGEITNALLDAANDGKGDPAVVLYAYDDKQGQAKEADSIEDLRKRGGSLSGITISIEKNPAIVHVIVRATVRPWVRSFGLADNEHRIMFGRIEDVFTARKNWLRNATTGNVPVLPRLLVWFLFVSAVLLTALDLKLHRSFILYGAVVYWLAFVLFAIIFHRRDPIYLVDSHERWKVTNEKRRHYFEKAATFVLGGITGAAISEGIKALASRLLK